jgi:hypothetical protein
VDGTYKIVKEMHYNAPNKLPIPGKGPNSAPIPTVDRFMLAVLVNRQRSGE